MKAKAFWTTWTADLAYVLGFAFADGGIGQGRNSLTLAQAKPDLLEAVQKVIGGDIRFSSGANVFRLRVCFTGLNQTLQPYGIVANKTKLGFWPSQMPDVLVRHYIRGFFDGDGCISRIKNKRGSVVSFVAHQESFLIILKREMLRLGIESNPVAKDGKNFRLRITRKAMVLKFYCTIYESPCDLFCVHKRTRFVSAATEIITAIKL